MNGVGLGTTLGGRYTLRERVSQHHGGERWRADDIGLDRRVVIFCLTGDPSRAAGVMDAAKRVAGIDNRVLARVLDAGSDGRVTYLVEEPCTDAQTLGALVQDGGLPADEVRRIVGETAQALEAAAQRGLHHLTLSPDDVLRTVDGEIRVRGVATNAAAAGVDDLQDTMAARQDAVRVVALTYAGLTGLWPLPVGGGRLSPAPRTVGGVPAPSELAAGVPRDLDTLCRLTLVDNSGPVSPGDFARQIAPWPARTIPGGGGGPVYSSGGPDHVPDDATRVIPIGATPGAVVGTPATPRATPAPGGDDDVTRAVPARGRSADELDGPTRPVPMQPTGQLDAGGGTLVTPVPAGVGAGAPGAAGGHPGAAPAPVAQPSWGTPSPRPAGAAPTTDHAVAAAGGPRAGGDAVGLEAPAPLLPATPLTKDESRVALGIVAIFLAIALAFGIHGVSQIGANTPDIFGAGPSAAALPTPSARASSASADPGQAQLRTLGIISASAFDPQGDGRENDGQVSRVFDGDPQTEWTSERYNTADFGGLKKGVGVIVDLGPNVQPKTLYLDLPTAADVELYVAPEPSMEGAVRFSEAKDVRGSDQKYTVPASAAGAGQYVIVWFTQLSQDDNGNYRAHLAEVRAQG